jgi:hypothetical protein
MAIRRYFIYSSGIASLALGFAILMTVLAINYATEHDVSVALANAEETEQPPVVQYAHVSSLQSELDAVLFEPSPTPLPSSMVEAAPTRNPAPGRAPLPPASVRVNSVISSVNVTFYDCLDGGFCGRMYNGEPVYEGAAACSWNLPIGTAFYIVGDPTGRIYVCKDRGLLDDTWVDIFWHDPKDGYVWQATVGRYATIAIVSVP